MPPGVAASHVLDSSRTMRSLGPLLGGLICAAALATGGAVVSPAAAGPLAVVEGEKLDIKASKLDVDIDKGTALLEGNVEARLGELTVTCPKVEIRYDQAPRVRWVKGSGGVRARVKGIDATASSVVVDLAKREVTLTGGVRLARGKGWVEADKATIDLSTKKLTLHDVKGSIPVEPPAR